MVSGKNGETGHSATRRAQGGEKSEPVPVYLPNLEAKTALATELRQFLALAIAVGTLLHASEPRRLHINPLVRILPFQVVDTNP